MNSIDPLNGAVQTEMRGWEAGIRRTLTNDAFVAKLEAEHPGTIDAALSAGRPLALDYLQDAMAKLQAKKIDALAAALTMEELNQFLAFAISSTGKKFFNSMHANASPETLATSVIDRANETGDRQITKNDADQALKRTLAGVQKDLSAADTLAIMKFEQSPAGKKLGSINAEIRKMTLEAANNPDSEMMSKQATAMQAGMIAFGEARASSPK